MSLPGLLSPSPDLTRASVLAVLACAAFATTGVAQEAKSTASEGIIRLPAPSGAQKVGFTSFFWADGRRPDTVSDEPMDTREMMVHVWYPARVPDDAEPGPYRPLAMDAFANIEKHSYPGAAFAEGKGKSKLILLCPGRGTAAAYYTSIAEELASHGYAVVAVDSKHIGYVAFPDGREVYASGSFRPSRELMTGPYEKVDEFFEQPTSLGAGDIDFALGKLRALNKKDAHGRFTGRLDLSRMGAFGHSLGGRICGEVVSRHPQFVAYASMEGVPPRQVRRSGLRAAVSMIYGSYLPEAIALPNIEEVLPNRRNDAFIVKIEGFGHNSVTDRPLVRPGSYSYDMEPLEGLRLTRDLLREFFDAYVSNKSLYQASIARESAVSVRKYPLAD